jgi:hypothetical protein
MFPAIPEPTVKQQSIPSLDERRTPGGDFAAVASNGTSKSS